MFFNFQPFGINRKSYRPETFPNFCAWAFHEMVPALFALKYGGRFPWETEPGVAHISCSDSKNPVVFKITLMD